MRPSKSTNGIFWVNKNWVLAIYSVSVQIKVPNKTEAFVGYFGVFLGILSHKIYTVIPTNVHLTNFVSLTIRPSCYLLNHWAEFYQTCYITSPHSKGVPEENYLSMPLSVHLSSTLSPPKLLGRIQTHSITSPHGKGESNIIFLCVLPPSICLSSYLLNHWAEFNQTCYITSPPILFFLCIFLFVCHPPICLSCYLLNHKAEFI